MKLSVKLFKPENGQPFEIIKLENIDKKNSFEVLLSKMGWEENSFTFCETPGGAPLEVSHLFIWHKIKDELDRLSDLKERLTKLFFLKSLYMEVNITNVASKQNQTELDFLIELVNNDILYTESVLSNIKEVTRSPKKIVGVINNIKWTGSETELVYLFDLLFKENLIDINQHQERFSLISKHFINRKEQPFNNKQLAQANQNIVASKNKKPKRAKLIETLVASLKQT